MHQHAATPRHARLPTLNSDEALSVRLMFENPSPEYGYSYLFGIREAFAKKFCRDINVEQRDVRRGSEGTVTEIIGNFYTRCHYVREHVGAGLCVYWMVVRIGVPSDEGVPNLMPAMVCAAFLNKTVLATKFDTLLVDPNDDEDLQMAACHISAKDIIPATGGHKQQQAFAESIVQTVYTGLQTGYADATPQLLAARMHHKPH